MTTAQIIPLPVANPNYDSWSTWLTKVEARWGNRIVDGDAIDMLYNAWLADKSAAHAVLLLEDPAFSEPGLPAPDRGVKAFLVAAALGYLFVMLVGGLAWAWWPR